MSFILLIPFSISLNTKKTTINLYGGSYLLSPYSLINCRVFQIQHALNLYIVYKYNVYYVTITFFPLIARNAVPQINWYHSFKPNYNIMCFQPVHGRRALYCIIMVYANVVNGSLRLPLCGSFETDIFCKYQLSCRYYN